MTQKEILEYVGECEEEVIKYDDLDDAIIGYANPWDTSGTQPTRLVYSASKCIECFMRNGMSEEDYF
jgi:hypothetical protein